MYLLLLLLAFIRINAQLPQNSIRNGYLSIRKLGDAAVTGYGLGVIIGENYEVCHGQHGACPKVDQFLGINYAHKPKRFEKAALFRREYHGSFKYQAPACYQCIAKGGFEERNPAAKMFVPTNVSEDCLYLNLWSPRLTTAKNNYPVMVWISGGDFSSGSASLDVYDGKVLSASQQLVVVSIQYRVGPFGFAYMPNKNVPGNLGLHDQQLALQWVKDRISFFRGNSNKITIFGHSAGAASVGFHYLNSQSRNLFHRAIMMSGSPFNRWALNSKERAMDVTDALIERCDCHYDQSKKIECLKSKTAEEIETCYRRLWDAAALQRGALLQNMNYNISSKFLDGTSQYFQTLMRPVLDNDFIKECPTYTINSFNVSGNSKELIVGNVDSEGMNWLLYGLKLKGVQFLSSDGKVNMPQAALKNRDFNFTQLLDFRFKSPSHLSKTFKPDIQKIYHLYDNQSMDNEVLMKSLDYLAGDMDVTCGTILFGDLLSNITDSNVYLYDFMHKTTRNELPDWTGAMQGSEIQYVFGMPLNRVFRDKYYGFDDDEMTLSREMMKRWGLFALIGNPNGNAPGEWLKYNRTFEAYYKFNVPHSSGDRRMRGAYCNFWNEDVNKTISAILEQRQEKFCPNLEKDVVKPVPLRYYVISNVKPNDELLELQK